MKYVSFVLSTLVLLLIFCVIIFITMVVRAIEIVGMFVGRMLPPETAHRMMILWFKYFRGPWEVETSKLRHALKEFAEQN